LCEYHIFGSPLFIKDMSRISLTVLRWRLQFVGKWRNRRHPPKNATAYYFIAWPLFQLNVKKISVEKKK
jgi:hypothetical protein